MSAKLLSGVELRAADRPSVSGTPDELLDMARVYGWREPEKRTAVLIDASNVYRWMILHDQDPAPDCLSCAKIKNGSDKHAPRHMPSTRCQSGNRPHCTCDTCF